MPLLVEQGGGHLFRPLRWRGRAVAVSAAFGSTRAVVSARGRSRFACAVFPDGTLHQGGVTGKRMAARTQADVMCFSMLAAGSRIRPGWPGRFAAQIDRGARIPASGGPG